MTIAHIGLKVKVMGQANAVGSTSIEGSFFYFENQTKIIQENANGVTDA